MKTFFLLPFFILFSFTFTYGAGFNSIHTSDGVNVVAVGDAGLVFKSNNGGNTWAAYTINSENLSSVFVLGNDVWIGGPNGKVYKTQTSGSGVQTIQTPLTVHTVRSLYFINSSTGYLSANSGFVLKTTNGGVNWTSVSTGLPTYNLSGISFLDENTGVVVGNNGSFYVTTNGGTAWTQQTTATSKNFLRVKYFSDGIAACGEFGLLALKPNAQSVALLSTRTNSDIRGVSGTSIANVHICGGGGFIRNNTSSSIGFLNFEENPMLANLSDIIYYNATTAYAVSSLNNAIIKTTNGGSSWQLTAGTTVSLTWELKLPGSNGIGNNLCQHPLNRDGMFVVYGNTVYRSLNRGETWANVGTLPSGRAHSFYVSPLDTNVWMAAIDNTSPDKVVRSTNYGATWTTVLSMNFSNYGQPLEMDQNNPSTYYFAPDGGGFYKSTDNGATFSEISGNYPFRSPCDIIVEWDNSNTIFLGDGETGFGQAILFKSTNGGVNWTQVLTATASEIPSITNTVFDKSKLYCTEWSGSNIYKSTNNGTNWVVSHNNGFSGWASGFCLEDPTFVITGNYGVSSAISTNSGTSWITSASGLSGSGAGILIPDRGFALNMQTGSLYKLKATYSVITSIPNAVSTELPDKYELHQNYPNPFNPSTVIKFDIPEQGNVQLKVYDQLGKEVAVLYNGFSSAGKFEVNFNASNLSSGIYFYKLITNSGDFTKKMLLVK